MITHNNISYKKYILGNYSKYKKGFSLTELTLALGVLGLFVTIITIAIMRGQTTSLAFSSDKLIITQLEDYTKKISATPFINLYNRDIQYPDSQNCPGENSTCPKILNKVFRINYELENVSENDNDSDTVDYIIIRGTASWDNATFSHEEVVYAPTPNWRPNYGVVQVILNNPNNLIVPQIFLINYLSGQAVASVTEINNNLAFISAPLDSCSKVNGGCVLALESNGSSSSDNITIDANSATIPFTTSQDSIKIINPSISNISKINLQLFAKNGGNQLDTPDKLNSICFYLIFHDGVSKRYLPYCNSLFNDKIVIEDYTPDTSRPWNKIALSSDYQYKLSMYYKDETCPGIQNMQSLVNGNWQNISSCFYWNWGEPYYISDGIELSNYTDKKINLLAGINNFTLTWTPDNNSPASGGNYMQPLWSKPRDLSLFDNPATCTNDINCNSLYKVGPTLVAPRTGAYQVPALVIPNNSGYDFTLVIKDYDDIENNSFNSVFLDDSDLGSGSINKFQSTIINGEPIIVESQLSNGELIGSSNNGYYAIPLRIYTSNQAIQSITIKMVGKNGIRYEKIYITNTPVPVTFFPESTILYQGDQSYIKVLAIDSHGNPAISTILSGTSSNGITLSQAVTNSEGYALLPIQVGNVQSGISNITIFNDSFSKTNEIYIKQRTGAIISNYSLSNPVNITQGGEKDISFTILDRYGTPIPNTGLTINIFRNNNFTGDITVKNNNCITNESGNCTVKILANKSAVSGTYQILAKSANVSIQINLNVSQKVNNIITTISTVTQGSSSQMEVRVLDGAGDPMNEIDVSAELPGFTFQSGKTNISGNAILLYNAEINVEKGMKSIPITAGNITKNGYIRVNQKVNSIITKPVTVNQGSSTRSSIKILDGNNQPITGVFITATSNDNIKVLFEPSFTDGVSYFQISVPASVLPGSYLINLTYNENILDILTVRVSKGIGSITVNGNISENQGSTIDLLVKDFEGSPISNREIKVDTTSSAILLGTLTNNPVAIPITLKTNSNGVAELKVFAKNGIAETPIKLSVESSGSKYTVFIEEILS